MSSKSISGECCGELVPTDMHGLWSWLSVVAVPAAETCRDPCDEGERARRMGVFLLGGRAFEFARQSIECDSKTIVDDIACWARAAISGIDQLECADGGGERNCGEVEQALGINNLGVLEREPVALERSEQLFDAPTQAIKVHDLLSVGGAVDRMSGQQPPQQRGLAGRRAGLPMRRRLRVLPGKSS